MEKHHKKRRQINKKAILIAHFGTTYPSALPSLDNIKQRIMAEIPGVETRICFTSNMVRNTWRVRRRKPEKWIAEGVTEEFLNIQGLLGAIGNLQDANYRTIIVQPTHMYHGEQFEDLKSYIRAMQSIRTVKRAWQPFEKVVLSRPALGTWGIEHDYSDDIEEVVALFGEDIERSKQKDAAMVYVAHGNDFFSSSAFSETCRAMREAWPDASIHIGVVEGRPGIEDILGDLASSGRRNVILRPFMITAGDHAHNDIADDGPDSWKGAFEAAGYRVETRMEGLGADDRFASIFAKRILETATDNGIDLVSEPVENNPHP
ncbi:sirohydrochlorin cobaltochelatase [Chlorobium sp. N1]|uniref:sirohydrochlorin cobaltochelatase n=1 Tax=Chlorobium sp. N1 TaxID=2491138 RepID=UPI00103FBD3B|nr:sirohydrochlorin cobaltochelatase [Chlorobium sp. N1]TCD47470.1 sirohydrochlorin cobaltochelatase [Chlorobium sp. N1]